jgi:YgiT-type zinc finger domain-containing protein
MTCRIDPQHGDYEERTVLYTAKLRGEPIIIEDVPALVCPLCGDTLFTAQTLKQIERIKEGLPAPTKQAPVFTLKQLAESA